MFSKKTLAAALVAATTLTAAPASADSLNFQFGFGGPGYGWHGGPNWQHHDRRVSPREVRHMLRDRGYHQIDFLDRSGRTYEVRARKNGRTFYIVVSARSGEIISRHRI
jgi:hypothetical protein